jgi:Fic family protein
VSAAGYDVPIVWQGRRAKAFVPIVLAERDLALAEPTIRATAAATARIEAAAADLPVDYAPLARLLLRAEGIASSFIEGITAPVVEVVLAEVRAGAAGGTAGWVAANLGAISTAVEQAETTPFSVELMCGWHATLMAGSPTPHRLVGRIRDEQGWIGGTTPLDAVLVTPPADELPRLLADLVGYVNRDDVDPVTQAAVAHAQFEIIHPFGDGNGRVGRILVAYLLSRRMSLLTPPPVSTGIAADVFGYSAGLASFRLGDHDSWVRWFAEAVSGAGAAQQALVRRVEEMKQEWRERVADLDRGRSLRSDSSVWRVLELLPVHLVVTASLLEHELGLSNLTARRTLQALTDAGILVGYDAAITTGRGRPQKLFVSPDLLGLTGSTPLR